MLLIVPGGGRSNLAYGYSNVSVSGDGGGSGGSGGSGGGSNSKDGERNVGNEFYSVLASQTSEVGTTTVVSPRASLHIEDNEML